VFDSQEIVKKACLVIQNKLVDLIQMSDSNLVRIVPSSTVEHYSTILNSFDIVLKDEDYTIGTVIEYFVYQKKFVEEKTVTYCGFKKFHPHDADSTLRIAFPRAMEINDVNSVFREACVYAEGVYKELYNMF
jgi:DNA-directed RNA polymerase subunit L